MFQSPRVFGVLLRVRSSEPVKSIQIAGVTYLGPVSFVSAPGHTHTREHPCTLFLDPYGCGVSLALLAGGTLFKAQSGRDASPTTFTSHLLLQGLGNGGGGGWRSGLSLSLSSDSLGLPPSTWLKRQVPKTYPLLSLLCAPHSPASLEHFCSSHLLAAPPRPQFL